MSLRRFAPACALLSLSLVACGDDGGSDGSGGGGDGGSAAQGSPTSTGTGTGTGSSSTGGIEPGEPARLSGITAAHNVARANVVPAPATPMAPLAWDDGLAAMAQAWAEECIWEHSCQVDPSSTNCDFGENLYANAGSSNTTPTSVVESWVSEDQYYDYDTMTCAPNQMCGHYTQVVWADSLRVGCGVADCSTGSPFDGFTQWTNWVCNYDPPGNWVGERPY